jgi:hypothetical protein
MIKEHKWTEYKTEVKNKASLFYKAVKLSCN